MYEVKGREPVSEAVIDEARSAGGHPADAETPDVPHIVLSRVADLLDRFDPKATEPADFLAAQFDLGLAWVHWPEGSGGLGVKAGAQSYVRSVLTGAGAPLQPTESMIGLGMCAPAIATHGTSDQKTRFLRSIFAGTDLWCQLFSEPGAGSDVAGLSTAAVKVPGGWRVNGQKVWTTVAQLAGWGLLLARSAPDLPKHRGLTAFLLDMNAPGVEIRPLYQMTGEAEFNEVYLTDVFIRDDLQLGPCGAGWSVAITTLMNERATIGSSLPESGAAMMADAFAIWHERGCDDPLLRDRVVQLWVRAELACLTARRAEESGGRGTPGPEGSIGKLVGAELAKEIAELSLELLGPEGLLHPLGYELRRPPRSADTARDVSYTYLRSRAYSIEGGTSDIMRNILSERVLGMPSEERSDKDVPWRDVPRG